MLCEKPSKMLGLSKIKGSLEVGKQADIVIFDPEHQGVIGDEDIYNRHKEVCIYKGKSLRGKVVETYLRG